MARPKEFEKEEALEAAINVFREHGFAGTSAGMLTEAMKIGRQSLYDTFGDKWQLYCLATQRYAAAEIWGHLEMLRGDPKAMDGIRRMIERVVAEARRPCLGVSSISEFGEAREDLAKIRDDAGRVLRTALVARIREAQAEGDAAADLNPEQAASFLRASIAAIRLTARGGAADDELRALGQFALQALK